MRYATIVPVVLIATIPGCSREADRSAGEVADPAAAEERPAQATHQEPDTMVKTGATSEAEKPATRSAQTIHDFTVTDIDGEPVDLSRYAGKVLLVVNTASRCGFTPQYEGLQALHETYAPQGFAVLGFPANNFGNQEPGTDEQIKAFCTERYEVTFPLFSKISVKGDDKHPLYVFLTESDRRFAGEISWNFNKFLVGPDGKILARYPSKTSPLSPEITGAVRDALASR